MKNNLLTSVIIVCILVFIPFQLKAGNDDDNETNDQTRISATIEYNQIKNLSLSLSPELRYKSGWTLKKYLLEMGASYEISKWFSIEGTYYAAINKRQKKGNEYQHKYKIGPAFDTKFNDLKTGIKMYYSNFSAEGENSDFFRFKYYAKYKFKNPDLTPGIGAEYYYSLADKESSKIRYYAELSYKLFKHNSISLDYKLDDFYSEKQSKNIYGLNYKIEF